MKRIAIFAAVFVFILLLTRIANQMPPEPPSGTSFSLWAQQVVECTPQEITLVDNHQTQTHLEKDLHGRIAPFSKRMTFWISTCPAAKRPGSLALKRPLGGVRECSEADRGRSEERR